MTMMILVRAAQSLLELARELMAMDVHHPDFLVKLEQARSKSSQVRKLW